MKRTAFFDFKIGDEVFFLRKTKCRLHKTRRIKKGEKGIITGIPTSRKGVVHVQVKKGFYLAFKREVAKIKPKQNERKRTIPPKQAPVSAASRFKRTAFPKKGSKNKRAATTAANKHR